MKGFKALNKDMSANCGDIVYKLDKTYEMPEEKIKMCFYGFHFCEKLESCNTYYDLSNSRIFEIEAEGKIIKANNEDKIVCNKITLTRELTKEEILEYIKRLNDYDEKNETEILDNIKLKISFNIDLDKYLYHSDEEVREMVAKQGYRLDILVNDESYIVREMVAEQGYGLEILVNDKNRYVRRVVAAKGYGLDILINDKDEYVREMVAANGYGLDILEKDECAFVARFAKWKKYQLPLT